ncbi:MAG: hypothetical protein BM556_13030 [Bacteriovorax sp. MedPE-SWde]|nr:MAG: hypothetical protein BM556_13030 [Bacteriovorax sp. MedPE-SWde]
MIKKIISTLILLSVSSTAFSNELDPEAFSIGNYGYYESTSVFNTELGNTKLRSIDQYTNTYRANTIRIEGEKKIDINSVNNLFLFIEAKGQYQLGKHSDPYVEFFELNNEVQTNAKVNFSAVLMKEIDSQFFGFGLNEVEIERISYMYRDEVSDDKSFVEESHISSKVTIGPSYGVLFDGSDHYFFIKASTGFTVIRDSILDDQNFVNFTIDADYNYLDTIGLYTSYNAYVNSDVVESSVEFGAYLKAADFKIGNYDTELRLKAGITKTKRDSSRYSLEESQFHIGLELRF